MEEEVLEMCKVEETKKDAYKGRGEPLTWQIVKKEKRYQSRKCEKTVGLEISHGLQNTALGGTKVCRKEGWKNK